MIGLETKQTRSEILKATLSKLFVHYIFGNGRTFDLGSKGLLSEFRRTPSVRTSVRQFKGLTLDKAIEYATHVKHRGANRPPATRISFRQQLPYDVTRDGKQMFALGNGNLRCHAQCELTFDWRISRFDLNAGLFFSIRDRFVDARDIHDSTPGNQEFPGGKPFTITARWTEDLRIPHAIIR